jgi:hypothetical protein
VLTGLFFCREIADHYTAHGLPLPYRRHGRAGIGWPTNDGTLAP